MDSPPVGGGNRLTPKREAISSDGAPEAVGPYSQAVRHGSHLFCSGQLPIDPESGEKISGGVAEQTTRCLLNLEAVCEAAGCSLGDSVKLTVYTTRLGEFAEINRAYAEYFSEGLAPARAAVGVSDLPLGVEVEIDAIVACG